MPHVVLKGKIKIESIFDKLKPIFIKNNGNILKTQEVYLERKKTMILIDSLVIESEQKASFFTIISSRENSIVVRLFPNSKIKKTKGVKKLLAEIVKQLIEKFPELIVSETNLEEYLW